MSVLGLQESRLGLALKTNTHLFLGTENVGIILLELPNTSKTVQRSRCFVSVQDTEIRNSHRKLSVASFTVAKEKEVTRAVHGLKTPFPLFNVKLEHVVLVMSPVARCLP